jgi:hypothetical protein
MYTMTRDALMDINGETILFFLATNGMIQINI